MDPRSKNIIVDPVYKNRTEYIIYKNRRYRNIFVTYYCSVIIAEYSGMLKAIKNKVVGRTTQRLSGRLGDIPDSDKQNVGWRDSQVNGVGFLNA